MKTREQVLQEITRLLICEIKTVKAYTEYRSITKKELRKLIRVINEYVYDLKSLVSYMEG